MAIVDNSSHLSDIQGYSFIHNPRVDRDGGGVGLYLAEHLKFKNRTNLTFVNDCAESLFVEVIRPTEKKIVIGVIYRPPDRNLNEFIGELDQLLSRISKENKLVYLLADWNINLLCHSNHHATGEFLELMYSKTFFPLIMRPTRITEHKASLIDNILTNDPLNSSTNGRFLCDISDHLPIFSIVSTSDLNTNERQFFVFRDKNSENITKFKEELSRVNWAELPDVNDPLLAYNSFLTKYTSIYNVCFPLRKVKVKKYTLYRPWFTKGLSRSVKKKHKLYKQFLKHPSPKNEFLYKSYKNKLSHTIRIAKKVYYERKLEEAKSSAKQTWKILNEVLNKRSSNRKISCNFNLGNKELTDPKSIAEQFCKYFSNIGPALAKNISTTSVSHRSFLSGNFLESLFLDSVSEQEVIEICKSLKSGTAVGYDNVSVDLVKQCAQLISSLLTHIINMSIVSGIVPDELKIARVIPLFKSGDRSLFTNYRPVSVLPAFSKIFERAIYNRLLSKSSLKQSIWFSKESFN